MSKSANTPRHPQNSAYIQDASIREAECELAIRVEFGSTRIAPSTRRRAHTSNDMRIPMFCGVYAGADLLLAYSSASSDRIHGDDATAKSMSRYCRQPPTNPASPACRTHTSWKRNCAVFLQCQACHAVEVDTTEHENTIAEIPRADPYELRLLVGKGCFCRAIDTRQATVP